MATFQCNSNLGNKASADCVTRLLSTMNECLTTPQYKNKIGYWVSNKWYLHKKVKIKYVYIENSQHYKQCKEPCINSLSLIYELKLIKLTLKYNKMSVGWNLNDSTTSLPPNTSPVFSQVIALHQNVANRWKMCECVI